MTRSRPILPNPDVRRRAALLAPAPRPAGSVLDRTTSPATPRRTVPGADVRPPSAPPAHRRAPRARARLTAPAGWHGCRRRLLGAPTVGADTRAAHPPYASAVPALRSAEGCPFRSTSPSMRCERVPKEGAGERCPVGTTPARRPCAWGAAFKPERPTRARYGGRPSRASLWSPTDVLHTPAGLFLNRSSSTLILLHGAS